MIYDRVFTIMAIIILVGLLLSSFKLGSRLDVLKAGGIEPPPHRTITDIDSSLSTGVCQKRPVDTVYVADNVEYVLRHGRRFPSTAKWVEIQTSDHSAHVLRPDDYAALLAVDTVYVADNSFRMNELYYYIAKCDSLERNPDTVYVTDTVRVKINIEDVLNGTGGPKWEEIE